MFQRLLKGLFVVLGSLVVIGPTSVRAETWRHEPLFGADVRSFAIDPADVDHVYAGTSGGQVYVSGDGGESWRDAGAALPFPGWVISSLQFDPDRPQRLWVAARGVYGGGLVAFTEDEGQSWTVRRGGLEDQMVFSLALVPDAPGTLYAGTRDGVFGTTDDGIHWVRLTGDVPELRKVTSLAVDPQEPGVLLAGTWRRVYRSDDGGRTWRGAFTGMVEDTEVFTMRPVPERPGELWASTCGWVYHGLDWGSTWSRVKGWPFERRRTLSFAVASPERLFAGTVDGLEVSTDGGTSWRREGPEGVAVMAIAWDARRPQRLLVGLEGPGVWRSRDGGTSFESTSSGLTNVRVSSVLSVGSELYVAIRDAGSKSGVWRSRDGASGFVQESVKLPPVLDLAASGGRILAATERGLYERRGSEWRRVEEIGTRRVEFVESGAEGAVVATREGLFRLQESRFVPLPYSHGTPRSAAVLPNSVWVTDSQAVYRLEGPSNHTLSFPGSPRGKLVRMGSEVLWSAENGLFQPGEDGEWRQVSDLGRRAFETGHSSRPVALVDAGGQVELLDARGQVQEHIALPVPADQVSGVAIHRQEMLLATNGQGLWSADLEPDSQ